MSEDNINHIAIIGAGNLGSRHFQALLKLERARDLYVVDPFDQALNSARKIMDDFPKPLNHQCHYLKSLEDLPQSIDLAVIATNSNERFKVFKRLIESVQLRHVLFEKVLFPRLEEYQMAGDLLRDQGVAGWVNCPRRMFPEFQMIRKHFYQNERAVFTATGNMWQLGCNSIHTFDLFAFLTGDQEVRFETDLLDREILQSKRKGYVEFTGTLYGKSERGNFIQMTSTANHKGRMPAVYSIANARAHFIIHRGAEAHYDYALAEEGWLWKRGKIITPFQSDLTQHIVNQIESGQKPSLPDYNESAVLHKEIISAFCDHLDWVGHEHRAGECMIT